jgi:hypothetical protein
VVEVLHSHVTLIIPVLSVIKESGVSRPPARTQIRRCRMGKLASLLEGIPV